jgi:hypothetical protein
MIAAAPGDILAVRESNGIWSKLIRFSEWWRGLPDLSDHCVVVTHKDQTGRWIGIAGGPRGVAVCDCTAYLQSSLTRSNYGQPRRNNHHQLSSFLASCAKSLGIAYDWVGIVEDTLDAFDLHDLSELIDPLWRWPTEDNVLPGHVVCSSLAARLYEIVGWEHPDVGTERVCVPAQWWQWNNNKAWRGV